MNRVRALILISFISTAWITTIQAVSVHVVTPVIDPRAGIADEVRGAIVTALEASDKELESYARDLAENPVMLRAISENDRAMVQGQISLMRTIVAAAKSNDLSLMNESELRKVLEMNRDVLRQASRLKKASIEKRTIPDMRGMQRRVYQTLPTSMEDLLKLLAEVRDELKEFSQLCVEEAESLVSRVARSVIDIPYGYLAERMWPYALIAGYYIYITPADKIQKAGFSCLLPIKRVLGGVKGTKPVAQWSLDHTSQPVAPEHVKVLKQSYDFDEKPVLDKEVPLTHLFDLFGIKIDPKQSFATVAVAGIVKDRLIADAKALGSCIQSLWKQESSPAAVSEPDIHPLSEDERCALCVDYCTRICLEPEVLRVGEVVMMTAGCTRTQMHAIFSYAECCARAQECALAYRHVEQAVDTLVRHIDGTRFPVDTLRTACARAGEALCIALFREGIIAKVTIHPVMHKEFTTDGAVFVESAPIRDRASLKRLCMRALAPLAAHEVLGIEPSCELMMCAKRDAFNAAYVLVCDGAADDHLSTARRESAKNDAWECVEQCYQTIRELLAANKDLLMNLRDRLMRDGSVDRTTLADLMRSIE